MSAARDGVPHGAGEPATSFAALGSGTRGPQVPPDDGRLRLVLVRHGRTPANVRHVLDTRPPGPSLDALGRAQAEEVAGLLSGWPVRAVHSSHAVRARETAAAIADRTGHTVGLLAGCHEIFAGDLEGRDDRAARDRFDEVYDGWWDGDPGRPLPGGESALDLWERFLPDVAAVTRDVRDGAVVLVSHGAAIRLVTHALLAGRDGSGPGRPDAGYGRDNPVPNTGRVVLRRDPDGWSVDLWDPMPARPDA